MKVKCNQALKGLDEQIIPTSLVDQSPFTIGKAIANVLIAPKQASGFDAFKAYETAKKFYKEDEVELDSADFDAVEKAVKQDQNYSVLVLGQVLSVLREAKNASEKS